MVRTFLTMLALAAWVGVPLARAQSADEARPDPLADAVQPYRPVPQRAAFLQAAGVNGELDESEFDADRAREAGFARPFDTWDRLKRYDRDMNGSIDWFEADAYRRDLAREIIARHDTDADGKLTGSERLQAVRALSEVGPADGAETEKLHPSLAPYDADGNGKLSPAEQRKALDDLGRRHRRRFLQRYDANGNGTLDPNERKALRRDRRARRQAQTRQIELHWFDDDGDGQLSEAEKGAAKAFGRELGSMFKRFFERQMDLNADGEVTDEERKAFQMQWGGVTLQLSARFRPIMDADGDGTVTLDEQMAFGDHTQRCMHSWAEEYALQFDADRNGRYNPAEREKMLAGFQQELRRRSRRHDINANGRLEPIEGLRMIDRFSRDIGLYDPPTPPGQPEGE